MTDDACREISRRSRGTPRIANRLLKRVRDFAEVDGDGIVDIKLAKYALNLLDIDDLGLDALDRKLIDAIISKFGGGPVGLDTLSSAINEDSTTIEDVIEPYLMQLGFITRMPRGRACTKLAYNHMGIKYPGDAGAEQMSFENGEGN